MEISFLCSITHRRIKIVDEIFLFLQLCLESLVISTETPVLMNY